MEQAQAAKSEASTPDCLVEKFSRIRKLSAPEAMFLSLLQVEEVAFARNHEVIVQGRGSRYLYVLKQGWAFSYKILGSGKRQVLEFLLPGDVLGVREFAFDEALNFVTLSTDGVVCPFPKSRLGEMFDHFPRLGAALVQISTREQAILVERICNLGSRSAYQRVGHQLLELWVRLRAVGLAPEPAFDFPVSQAILADALGLSAVHVNRTLKRLKHDGLVKIENKRVEINDLKSLIEATEFEEFYLEDETIARHLK